MRILAVDDNKINLKLLCDVLESEGYSVDRALSADEAIALIDSSIPDLLLLDIAMPGMDGLTLTRKLKADETTKHLPIFIVTASAMTGDSKRAQEAGCDEYITKPVDMQLLLSKIATYK